MVGPRQVFKTITIYLLVGLVARLDKFVPFEWPGLGELKRFSYQFVKVLFVFNRYLALNLNNLKKSVIIFMVFWGMRRTIN